MEFTRVMWASDKARALWEPRVKRVSVAFINIERLSIADGWRTVALQTCRPSYLPDLARRLLADGLSVLPLDLIGFGGSYAAGSVPVVAGQPWEYRVAVGRPESLARYVAEVESALDDGPIGRLLGYPDCCRAWFKRHWVEEGSIDPTLKMVKAYTQDVEAAGPWQANILLRWLGVRAVPHLPCSFTCENTVRAAELYVDAGRAHGYAEEMGWLEQMLSWPMEYSALHGVLEVKTPVLKISATTVYTPHVRRLRRSGTQWPEEGARGVVFPYNAHSKSKSDRKFDPPESLERETMELHKIGLDYLPPARLSEWKEWEDNGFSSAEAMVASHDVIRRVLQSSPPKGPIVDLGCGNGALLAALGKDHVGVKLVGVESDWKRTDLLSSVMRRTTDAGVQINRGNLFDFELPECATVILMPGRLSEVAPARALALRTRLDKAHQVVVYAYGDWLDRCTLSSLVEAAGLGSICFVEGRTNPVAAAGVLAKRRSSRVIA